MSISIAMSLPYTVHVRSAPAHNTYFGVIIIFKYVLYSKEMSVDVAIQKVKGKKFCVSLRSEHC